MNDISVIYGSLEGFLNLSLVQIAISAIASSGIVTLYLKSRSDKQLERFKAQLEIYHFKETLGQVRADQQQADAVKEIWVALSSQRDGIVSFLGACDELDFADGDPSLPEFLAKNEAMNHAGDRAHIELSKFVIFIDDELAAQVSLTSRLIQTSIVDLSKKLMAKLDEVAVQKDKDQWKKGFLVIVKDFSFVEIDKQLDETISMMRKHLKVIESMD